jgi:hypothetical protein
VGPNRGMGRYYCNWAVGGVLWMGLLHIRTPGGL